MPARGRGKKAPIPQHKILVTSRGKELKKIGARLYEKVGFVEAARLRHQTMHFGRYTDNCIMEYRGK
jgi:L-amino acid N-acyltransferase YncA